MFSRAKLPKQKTESVQEPKSSPRITLTIEDLQKELHISRATAYKLVHQKGFPSFCIGTRILINRQDLQEWTHLQTLLPKSSESDEAVC